MLAELWILYVNFVGSQSEQNSVKVSVLLDSNGGRAVDLVGLQSEQNRG
jgi:hypothetical protein